MSVSGKDVARESLAKPVRTFGGCSRRRQRVNRAHLFDDIFNANEADPLTAWAGTFVGHWTARIAGGSEDTTKSWA